MSGTIITGKLQFPKEKEYHGKFIKYELVTRSKHGYSFNLHYTLCTVAELAADPTIVVARNDQEPADVAPLPAAPTGAQIAIRAQELSIYERNMAEHQKVMKAKGEFQLDLAAAIESNTYIRDKILSRSVAPGTEPIITSFTMSLSEMYIALKALFIVDLSVSDIEELLNKQSIPFKFTNGINKEEAIRSKFVEIENITSVVNESRGPANHTIEAEKVRMLKNIFNDPQLERAFENAALSFNDPTYAQYKESIINWTKHLNSIDQARNISMAIVNNNNRYANEASVSNVNAVTELQAAMAELEVFRKAAEASKDKKSKSKANKGKKFPGAKFCELHKWCHHTTDQCREQTNHDNE